MSSTNPVSMKHLFAFCLFSFVLAAAPSSYSEEPSAKQSGEQMVEEPSCGMYSQAVTHAENALQATRGKDLNKAVGHAEMAIKTAHAAQRDFDTMKVEKEAQSDFAEGVKSLEGAVKKANTDKIEAVDKIEVVQAAIVFALTAWRESKIPHGDGCPLLAGTKCCANPGMLNCNRFYPARKCTNFGTPCVCYCM